MCSLSNWCCCHPIVPCISHVAADLWLCALPLLICRNYFDVEDWREGLAEWWDKKRSGEWSDYTLLTSPGPFLSAPVFLLTRSLTPYSTAQACVVVALANALAWLYANRPTVAAWAYKRLCDHTSPYSVWMRALALYSGAVKLPYPRQPKSPPAWDSDITWARVRLMYEMPDARQWFSMYWPKQGKGKRVCPPSPSLQHSTH